RVTRRSGLTARDCLSDNRSHYMRLPRPTGIFSLGGVAPKVPCLLAALVFLLAACGGAASAPSAPASKLPLKLTVGLASKPAPALPNSVLWLTTALGSYEREGLDPT